MSGIHRRVSVEDARILVITGAIIGFIAGLLTGLVI
jgi:hypothetical protein